MRGCWRACIQLHTSMSADRRHVNDTGKIHLTNILARNRPHGLSSADITYTEPTSHSRLRSPWSWHSIFANSAHVIYFTSNGGLPYGNIVFVYQINLLAQDNSSNCISNTTCIRRYRLANNPFFFSVSGADNFRTIFVFLRTLLVCFVTSRDSTLFW